jgi:CheY-like chemotaxis protein
MNVLIVEDNPTDRKLVASVLEAAGMNVSAVSAAELALAVVQEAEPQLLLVDLVLPGMDGLSLARLLRADPDFPDLCIVALTSFPERFTRPDARSAGCDDYLVKPIDTRALPSHLLDVAQRRKDGLTRDSKDA